MIQPGGPDDWKPANVPDPFIEAELAAGREVVAVLIGTPAWASRRRRRRLRTRCARHVYWEAFVRRMAQHYAGASTTGSSGTNRTCGWRPSRQDLGGSGSDYARLLKTAYRAIKEVDPTLQVYVAGLTYYWDWEHGRRRYLDRLLEIIAADPEAAANGVLLRRRRLSPVFQPAARPWTCWTRRGRLLARYGVAGKEIWINETNAPPSEDPQEPPWSEPRFRVSLEEQAAFVLQEFALAFSHGAERVEFYKLRNSADHPESIEPFGLLRADNSQRPAFDAYRVATTYLSGFRSAVHEQTRRHQRGDLRSRRHDDHRAVDRRDRARQVRVTAIAANALLVDDRGNTMPISAVNGAYTIALPGAACTNAPNCFIGGAPRLLVEQGAANSRSALAASAGNAAGAAAAVQPTVKPHVRAGPPGSCCGWNKEDR